TYTYVAGNPIRHIDALGLQSQTDRWIDGHMRGDPENGSLGEAMVRDALDGFANAMTRIASPVGCTMVCGVDATIGTSFESVGRNAAQYVGFKAAERGTKRLISDIAEICMSARIDRIALTATARVTPILNTASTSLAAVQFSQCVLRCGN